MKKILFFAALAAVALTACDKKSDAALEPVDDNAITFSAYTSDVTRGKVVVNDDIYGASKPGIGVFAFYQPAATGNFNTYKYAVPDFMYNQSVTSTDGTTWTYSPVKYWPNNNGDKVSFFAYAPYDANKTWEDLGVKTDVNAKKMTVRFAINQAAEDQVDHLYADPQLNLAKQALNGKVNFTFAHITSQVNLYVGVEKDEAAAATNVPMAWTDENTVIEVKSIELQGLSSSITYTYDLTKDPAATGYLTAAPSTEKQNVKLTTTNFIGTAATISKTNYGTANDWTKLNADNSVMFLAPQTLAKAIVTYTVTTTDNQNAANNSTITNTVEGNLSSLTMEKGKVYNLKFLIGMTSVKIGATVSAWGNVADQTVVLPVANY